MAFPPSAVRTALVWLLAVTSLVASAPRFDCACPNGDHKLCFPGLFSRGAGCCCGSVCCAPPSADQPNSTCEGGEPQNGCCACARHTSGDHSDPAGCLGVPCCKKTPAEADPLLEPPTKVVGAEQLFDWFSIPPASSDPFGLLPLACARPHAPQPYDLPPPPDLVVTLRHFII